MIWKIVHVRPGRISGWCFNPDDPGSSLVVELLVNGTRAAFLPCNRLRRDLDPARFPNRSIGFGGQLPVEYWTGEKVSVTLRLFPDGPVIDEREIETVDARIPDADGLFGIIHGVTSGRLTGWAATLAGPVSLDLAIDGNRFAMSEPVDRLSGEMPNGSGYGFWLPDEVFDGALHELTLTTMLPGVGRKLVGRLEQVFSPDDRRQLTGEITDFSAGVLSGRVKVIGWPETPVALVAEVGGLTAGRVTSEPDQDGAFALEIMPQAGFLPEPAALEIYEEFSGRSPAFLSGDLASRFLRASVTEHGYGAGTGLTISAVAPLPLASCPDLSLEVETAEGSVVLAVPLTADGPGKQFTAHVALSDLPQHRTALRLRSGAVILHELLAAAAEPALEGEWTLLAGGIVEGWARNGKAPQEPVPVSLRLNQLEVMSQSADRLVLRPIGNGVHLPVACGFRFDLGQLGRKSGVAHISVVAPDEIGLVALGATYQRFPATVTAAVDPGDVYGTPAYPRLDDADVARLLAPVEGELSALLHQIFGQPPRGATLAAALVDGALGLAERDGLCEALARPGALLDPALWNPLKRPSAKFVLTHLPLSQTGRAGLMAAQDWKALLRLLVTDALLLPAVLSRSDWIQMRALDRLRRAALSIDDPEPVVLPFGAPVPVVGSGQAAEGVSGVAVVDPEGNPVLLLSNAESAGLVERLGRQLRDPAVVLRPGWRLLTWRADGTTQGRPLVWRDERPEVAVPVQATVRFGGMLIAPRHATLDLIGQNLPGCAVLRLGAQTSVVLAATDGPDSVPVDQPQADRVRHYAATLPDWTMDPATTELFYKDADPARTFDLRLEEQEGFRPLGLPRWLQEVVGPGRRVHSEVTLSGGQLTGWIFNQSIAPGLVRVALIETRPPTPEQLERDPDAAPTDHVLVQAQANLASAEAERLHAVSSCGFALSLPVSLFDGQSHSLRLVVRHGAQAQQDEAPIWQNPDFVCTDDVLLAQITGCTTAEQLHHLLSGMARVRRFDLLNAYFTDPRRLNDLELSMDQTFEVLCVAAVQGGLSADNAEIERLFAALWGLTRQTDARSVSFAVTAARAALGASELSPARYPHAPVVESVLDIICSASLKNADAEVYGRFATACLQARRHRLALSYLERGLAAHPKDAGLLTQKAKVHLSLGETDSAETAIHAALAAKNRNAAAIQVLSRIYAHQGHPLHAASALTGGKGLSLWHSRPPAYEQSKDIAGLDWVGVMRQAAVSAGNASMLVAIERSEAVLGRCDRPEAAGLTVVLTGDKAGDDPDIFHALMPTGCLQVVIDAQDRISEIDCIGQWALLISAESKPEPALITALFDQLRPHDAVTHLLRGSVNDRGIPTGFKTQGAIIRSDALRAFGPVPLATFLTRAAAVLRVKTILI